MKKTEKARIERMMLLGCCACAAIGIPNYHQIECHHILQGNRRLGHWYTIPLCKGHHQGAFTVVQKLRLQPAEQASIAAGRKRFNNIFGTEQSLWERVQFLLQLDDKWPRSKVIVRRAA